MKVTPGQQTKHLFSSKFAIYIANIYISFRLKLEVDTREIFNKADLNLKP